MTVRIITGDALIELAKLPAESVHCCVTSPPYYGLRDYGVDAQLGLEPTPDAYVAAMVSVFREVRRVLRADGTLWLNIGDSYAAVNRGENARPRSETLVGMQAGSPHSDIPTRREVIAGQKSSGIKPKDLIGIPWMLAFALRADSWYLRQDIIWAKPNPMPESVGDRCTKAHEYLFLLSKSQRYYFDAAAIAEPSITPGLKVGGIGQSWHDHQDDLMRGDRKTAPGTNGQHQAFAGGRNKRSVWTIATAPYAEAHFATFPPALVEPCILAGCPAGGTVLDPFLGSGTTALVADRLGRSAIGIELNPAYAAMARRRIEDDAGLFFEAAQ